MKELSIKMKLKFSVFVAVFFLLMAGCQPEGGELLPIGGENVEITTSRFENDTAVINDNGLKLKLYGDWDGRAKVRIIVDNKSQNEVVVNLKDSIILDSKGKNIEIDSFSTDDGVAIKEIEGDSYSIKANEVKKLIVGFPLNLSSSIGDNPPRIISVILSIKTNNKTTEMKEYKFDFKGIDNINLSGKSDPDFK